MPKKHTFLVTLDVPDGMSLEDAEVYIDAAVRAWRGHSPDETMMHLDPGTVDVVAAASTRRAGEARKTPRI
jgi:hypothetical protein